MGINPFGVKYSFELGDRVERCDEYLMPLSVLAQVAAEFDLDLGKVALIISFDFWSLTKLNPLRLLK